MIDETHDPDLLSWVESANGPEADFPIQNLPFAVLRRNGTAERFRPALAIGDQALDLHELHRTGLIRSSALDACMGSTLNPLMALGAAVTAGFRRDLSRLLRVDSKHVKTLETCLIPLSQVEYALPCEIGDYTDFFTSIHHATNTGRLFRPDSPLLPNYRWVPVGYHGRSSSIGVSGQTFPRPRGQIVLPGEESPVFEACRRLDYELELGIFVGAGNAQGQPVQMDDAADHVFGLCLLNDWSARDIQAWEYQPLGPFLAKNFATTISPWIVTSDALAPFRVPWTRADGEPDALPHLSSESNRTQGAIDVHLEVQIQTASMRSQGLPPYTLSRSNFTDSYWTVSQLVAHHTSSGCNLRAGDLLGSGTMSGAVAGSEGALIEITRGGANPVSLPNGETRAFLEDGDTVILGGYCARQGFRRIGFGTAVGTVLPAAPGAA